MGIEALPESWEVWNDEPGGRAVLAFRSDVFDSEEFPAPCMPTLYVTRGPKQRRRPPRRRGRPQDDWRVTLFLEPEVNLPERSFSSREAALEGAVEFAEEFAQGAIDYRSAYEVPREEYLEKLDELTGRRA